MAQVPVLFGPNSDQAKATAGGGSTIENAYVEPTDGGKTAYSINTDAGLKPFSNVSAGQPGRGVFPFGNQLFAVHGEQVYSVSVTGVPTALGAIPGTLPVNFSQNMKSPNNQVTIVADTTNWFIENGVLTQITDPDLPAGVISSSQLNGFTIYFLRDARIFSSDINDTANVNALNFDQAQKYADQGSRGFIVGEEFWAWGTGSLEPFRYIGGTGFPFARMQGAGLGEGGGCAAKNSVCLVDNAPHLVSDKLMVVRYNGYSPQRVSDSRVERDIETAINAGLADQIIGSNYAQHGHQFYRLRCPLWCWVLDTMTGKWHRKRSYLKNTWDGGFYCFAFGKHLVQSAVDGNIYEQTFDANDEAGQPLITKLKSQIVSRGPNGFTCNAVQIDIQAGTGRVENTLDGIDPQIMMRVSRDGGKTYEAWRQQSMGVQANWNKTIRFNRLGRFPATGMVVEVAMSSPVERAVFQAFADVQDLAA